MPPHPSPRPQLGGEGGVRGLDGKQLNAVVLVNRSTNSARVDSDVPIPCLFFYHEEYEGHEENNEGPSCSSW